VKTTSKVVEIQILIRMTRGTKFKCSLIEVDSLIQVTWSSPLLKSVLETDSKVVERHGLIRMTRQEECKCSLVEVNGLI
jgi:hypothetical protein